MKSGHEEIKEMLPGYLGGSLPDEGLNLQVEAHLKECGECRDDLAFLAEILSVEVPDPGELFWKTLPGKVRLTAEAETRKGHTMRSLFRWLPVPVAVLLLLLALTYTYMSRKEMQGQDLVFKDPLTASVPDYSDITENDILQMTVQLADDELYLPRENLAGYSYHRELASLNSGEVESLYEALRRERQSGG
jgi:hypothetical protein